jgi:hypothetical protein
MQFFKCDLCEKDIDKNHPTASIVIVGGHFDKQEKSLDMCTTCQFHLMRSIKMTIRDDS